MLRSRSFGPCCLRPFCSSSSEGEEVLKSAFSNCSSLIDTNFNSLRGHLLYTAVGASRRFRQKTSLLYNSAPGCFYIFIKKRRRRRRRASNSDEWCFIRVEQPDQLMNYSQTRLVREPTHRLRKISGRGHRLEAQPQNIGQSEIMSRLSCQSQKLRPLFYHF